MSNSFLYIKFDIWLVSETRVIYKVGLRGPYLSLDMPLNRETIPLIHADKLVLVWASVTQSDLTFRLNFDCIIQPHVIFKITSSQKTRL